MKFDCGPSWEEKQAQMGAWNRWFAWRPVYLGTHDCRWLEHVMRRAEYRLDYSGGGWWVYEYRACDSAEGGLK